MKKLFIALISAAMVTIIFGTMYVMVQQGLRQAANYPQIAMAEDIAVQLDSGLKPADLVGNMVDLAQSLSPGVIIYDIAGQPLASSARLAGKTPVVPFGVLLSAKGRDYHAVTWQPTSDVRLASVSVAARSGYVTVVRSLREVEKQETKAMLQMLFGWSLAMVALGSLLLVVEMPERAKK